MTFENEKHIHEIKCCDILSCARWMAICVSFFVHGLTFVSEKIGVFVYDIIGLKEKNCVRQMTPYE
jgi:hypothetical protein